MNTIAFRVELKNWLQTGERGISSNAMVEVFEGLPEGMLTDGFGRSHPHDPADFRRCVALLNAVPGYWARLDELRPISPTWSALVDHWHELTSLLMSEEATGKAPKCYERMLQIIKESGEAY